MKPTGRSIEGHGHSYRMLRRIGSGGFGEVFLAEATTQSGLKRLVAIKLLRNKDNPETAWRLRDEARLLGKLHHKSIVSAEDLLEVNGHPALVMEYVPGANLSWLIRPDTHPPGISIRISLEVVSRVADALHTAWNEPSRMTGRPLRVLHRDVKPSNIRITPEGDVKLLDFGIARPEGMERESSTKRAPPGSRYYSAPELLLHSRHGPEVDVYSLGATLFECIARQRMGLAMDRQANHQLHVQGLVDGLDLSDLGSDSDALVQLLVGMVSYRAEDRPTAEQVSTRCRALWNRAVGPSLSEWAPETIEAVSERSSPVVQPGEDRPPVPQIAAEDRETVRIPLPLAQTVRTPIRGSDPRETVRQAILALLLLATVGVMILVTLTRSLESTLPPPPPAIRAPLTPSTPIVENPEEASPEVRTPSEPVLLPDTIPAPVIVVIQSEPRGIGVSINHVPVGTTPLRLPLATGTYELQYLDGRRQPSKTISISGENHRFTYRRSDGGIH